MKTTAKTSIVGKIIAIIASVVMIAFAFVNWIDLKPAKEFIEEEYSDNKETRNIVEDVLGEFKNEYSLLGISDFLKDIGDFADIDGVEKLEYFDEIQELDKYAPIPKIILGLIVFLGIMNIIFACFSYRASKIMTAITFVLSALIAGAFIVAVNFLNSSLDALGGDFVLPEKLLVTNYFPYYMIAAAFVACIGVRIKQFSKAEKAPATVNTAKKCQNCGAAMNENDNFCISCGYNANSAPEVESKQIFSNASEGNICPACGAKRLDGSVFCASCGYKFQN